MKFLHTLLALSALAAPASVLAQGFPLPQGPDVYFPGPGYPPPYPEPAYPAPQQAVARPAVATKPKPIEPIDLPPAIEQGVDMIFIDSEIEPSKRQQEALLHDISFDDWSG